jgi:maltose alpha-D-glucosyltransferase/alpha-amylase
VFDPLDLTAEIDPLPAGVDELLRVSREDALLLGRRTAELHLMLALPNDDPGFTPAPAAAADWETLAAAIRARVRTALETLKAAIPWLPDDEIDQASRVLSHRSGISTKIERLERLPAGPVRIRIHGDYHLGDTIRVGTNFLIDFEADSADPLEDRRGKHSPLRDVAGMIRSFGYAAHAALKAQVARRPLDLERLLPWASLWERTVVGQFVRAYYGTAGSAPFLFPDPDDNRRLLEGFLLDRAFHELSYELEHRPAWVGIPLAGLVALKLEK